MTLRKIISGGQTGADQAGLRAAKRLGLETGGWMPRGFKTEGPNRPEFAAEYGMRETESADYPPRTGMNVRDADATVIFTANPDSAGTQLTLRRALAARKHVQMVDAGVTDPALIGMRAREVYEWTEANYIAVLNVAGNRESSAPGIGAWVEEFLVRAFGPEGEG